MAREGAPAERLRGEVDKGEEGGADHDGRGCEPQLPGQERPRGDRGVVVHPGEREGVGDPEAEEQCRDGAPGEGRTPDDPPPPQEERRSDTSSDEEEEDDEDRLRSERDRVVR